MSRVNVLVPIDMAAANYLLNISEPETTAGETAWVSGTIYEVGATVIRTTTHRVYQCVQRTLLDLTQDGLLTPTGGGRTTLPENDPTYWLDIGPTSAGAMFDLSSTTKSTKYDYIRSVLHAPFCDSVALYGIENAVSCTVNVWDGPITISGLPTSAVLQYTTTVDLTVPSSGWYEYFFAQKLSSSKLVVTDLPKIPDGYIDITIQSSATTPANVSCSMVVAGLLTDLCGGAEWGGAETGVTAEPISYSYINTDQFGNTAIVPRLSTTGLSAKVTMPVEQADAALALVQSLLDTPSCWLISLKYQTLNVYGLASGNLTYGSPEGTASLNLKVKGIL